MATFGRGIYILDDYAPLRVSGKDLVARATLFNVRDSWLYVPDARRGWGGKGDWGVDRYTADNRPYGAVFSYYLPQDLQTLHAQRRKAEKDRAKQGKDNPYPSWKELRKEDHEEAPSITFTVRDASGQVVRRINGPVSKGFHRVAWDMRYPAPDPLELKVHTDYAPWETPPQGPLAVPGTYNVTLSERVAGNKEDLAPARTFKLKPMFNGGLVTTDRQALLKFEQDSASLFRAVSGAGGVMVEMQDRIDHLLKAAAVTPAASEAQAQQLRALNHRLQDLRIKLKGDTSKSSRGEKVPMSITGRISTITDGHWNSESAVTPNYRASYAIAARQFGVALNELKAISKDLLVAEAALRAEGAPWTPGRIPD